MAINMNHHVFKGHKTLLGSKYVTYAEVELPLRYDIFSKSSSGFDWGNGGSGAVQLAFSILFQLSDKEVATKNAPQFTMDVIRNLNPKDWIIQTQDVLDWIKKHEERAEVVRQESLKVISTKQKGLQQAKSAKKTKRERVNVVQKVCQELGITQKNLAEILEVPEGTVSSWAVKNEIPRLGRKAIEFFTANQKNQKIVESYKNFMQLLNTP